jgi:hypothetical protein
MEKASGFHEKTGRKMVKKAKRKNNVVQDPTKEETPVFPEKVETKFKQILRIMSWIVGICFTLIIILPNFKFFMVDFIVKFVFYLGVLNLFLFAILEMFGTSVKRQISKHDS